MTMELRFVPVRVEGQAWCSAWQSIGPVSRREAFDPGCPQDLQKAEVRLAQGQRGPRTGATYKEVVG